MGAQDSPDHDPVGMQATEDASSDSRVYVDPFWMDRTDVTNDEFARFVRATGYVTVAERTPTAEEFPGAPPRTLWPAPSCSRHRIIQCRSTRTCAGGPT